MIKTVCVIVEGSPDVVKMHQLGVNNVVAGCGTALTKDQIKAISKYTKNICLLYDSDRAGQQATDRNARLVMDMGMNALVLTISDTTDEFRIPQKSDPDTFFTSKDHFAALRCVIFFMIKTNKAIKEGRGNELWNEEEGDSEEDKKKKANKKRHKDTDARWTKKGGQKYYGMGCSAALSVWREMPPETP